MNKKKRKVSKNLISMIIMLLILLLLLAGVYVLGMRHYRSHFFRGSSINGVPVGEMTVDDAKYAIQDRIRDYKLTLKERNGITDTLTGDEIYMQYVDDGSIEKMIGSQMSFLWPLHLTGMEKKYKAPVGYTYDAESVSTALDQVISENNAAPVNAHIEENGDGYAVVDADQGATLKRDETIKAVLKAIEAGESEIDLEALDLYEKPAVTADDGSLKEQADGLNRMLSADITFDFVDRKYTVNREVVRSFITKNSENNYALDESKVHAWVNQMAIETDTFGLEHKFKTTSGETITLESGGDYGWATDVDSTARQLAEAIRNASTEEMKPVYTFEACDRSTNDIGGTYIEVSIEKQRLWCYKDGVLVVDTPIVTGNHATGYDTPSGKVWAIDAKMDHTTFREANNVRITYWLPFFDSCGMHDAWWRNQFGGDIWKTNGSHGCLNTPEEAAGKIYEVMEIGYPVIVYYSPSRVAGDQPTHEVSVG